MGGLTPRGLGLLGSAALLWPLGRFLGLAELYIVAATIAALVAAGAVAVRLSSATISVRRRLTVQRVHHGGAAEAVIDLHNDARLPASLLLLEDACHPLLAPLPRFVVPGLGAGRTVTLRYRLHGGARGRFAVGPLRIRVRDPFGTVQRVRRYRASDQLVVYPRIEPLETELPRGTHRGSGASEDRRLLHSGDEFYTMREYVTGDDLRLVHWPSTAHRDRLMVRQQEQQWHSQATVVCDTRAVAHHGTGRDSTLEKAVSAAASVVWHLADRGYELRLVTDDQRRPSAVEPRGVLLERLADARPTRMRSLAPALTRLRTSGGEGLLIAVLAPPAGVAPVARDPDVRALLQAGRAFSGRIALVCEPAGRDERARALVALLVSAGWRAATLSPTQRLVEPWALVAGARRARADGPARGPAQVDAR